MTETLGDLFSEGSNRRGVEGPTLLLDRQAHPQWMSVPEGAIPVLLARGPTLQATMSLASAPLLLLLASPPDIEVGRPYPEACEESARSITLSAESAWGSIGVCASAALATTFVFDSEVARVVLQDEAEFRRVDVDEGTLVLVPRRKSRLWTPSRMTVHFAGDAAPASVTFLLVPHPARLARQVEVFRFARPEEPCEGEVRPLLQQHP